MKQDLFESVLVYTVTDDDGSQYSVTITHHVPTDSYAYEVESLANIIVPGRKHNEILDYVNKNMLT